MSGPELCSALAASGHGLPAVLITGRDDSTTHRLIGKAHPVATRGPCSTRSRAHLLVPIDDSDDQRDVQVVDGTGFLFDRSVLVSSAQARVDDEDAQLFLRSPAGCDGPGIAIAVNDSRAETRWSKLEQWLCHP